MRLRSTLLLLAVVIVTAVVAHLLTGGPPAPGGSGGSSVLLPGLRPDDVQTVIIERPGQPRSVCQRQGDGWRLTEPVTARADGKRVDRILAALQAARTVATFALPDPAAGAPYGLDAPRYTITVVGPGGADAQTTVRFGDAMPVGDLTYVAVEGRHIVDAVHSNVAEDADATAASLRSSILVPDVDPAALQVLAISAGPLGREPAFALECRRSGGQWELTSPVTDLADADAVTQVAVRIRDFRATPEELVTASPADCGLDEPDLNVALTWPGSSQKLMLSSHDGDFYAMLSGESAPVRVPGSLFDALRRPPADLRDRALTPVQPAQVARIGLAGPHGDLELVRQPDGWQLAGPSPPPPTPPSWAACWKPSARRRRGRSPTRRRPTASTRW